MSIEPGPQDQIGAEGVETPPVAAPTYITAEQFIAAQGQIASTFQQINESLTALRAEAAQGRPGAAPVGEPLVTPEQYAQAVQTGDAGIIERYFDQKQARYHAQQVAPLQRDGYQIVGELQAEVRGGKLPYFDRYRKEITEALGQMPPQVRANADAVKIAHDLVVGRNAASLVSEAKEAALRAPAAGNAPGAPGAANSRSARADAVPSAAEWLGRDAAGALGNVSEDDWARRLGYKDWASYYKMAQEQSAEVGR